MTIEEVYENRYTFEDCKLICEEYFAMASWLYQRQHILNSATWRYSTIEPYKFDDKIVPVFEIEENYLGIGDALVYQADYDTDEIFSPTFEEDIKSIIEINKEADKKAEVTKRESDLRFLSELIDQYKDEARRLLE